jgi:hypothetical protein
MQKVKWKWLASLLIISILIVSMTIVAVVNTHGDQAEEDSGLDVYDHTLALDFYLNVAYDREGASFQLAYSPTEWTEDLLGRWQAITEVYPFMAYPEEAIVRNNWVEVLAVYEEGISQYREKALDDKEFSLNNSSVETIISYITINYYKNLDEELKVILGLD